MFIHGSDQDHCMLHLLNSDKTGFDVEKEINLYQFNIVQLCAYRCSSCVLDLIEVFTA